MRDEDFPSLRVGRRAIDHHLSPEIDEPRVTVFRRRDRAVKRVTLAEPTGVDLHVSTARDLTTLRIQLQVLEPGVVPCGFDLPSIGQPPAVSDSPRFEESADGGIEDAAGRFVPAEDLLHRCAGRVRERERNTGWLPVQPAHHALGSPRAQLLLGLFECREKLVESLQRLHATRIEGHERRARSHQVDLAHDGLQTRSRAGRPAADVARRDREAEGRHRGYDGGCAWESRGEHGAAACGSGDSAGGRATAVRRPMTRWAP